MGSGFRGAEEFTTWEYQPGSFTPIAQTSFTVPGEAADDAARGAVTAATAPQEEIDRRFYAIVTDLTGTPSELVADDGTLAG